LWIKISSFIFDDHCKNWTVTFKLVYTLSNYVFPHRYGKSIGIFAEAAIIFDFAIGIN
jgi:hypothetical protein